MGLLTGNYGDTIMLTRTIYLADMNQDGLSGLPRNLLLTLNGKSCLRSRTPVRFKRKNELYKTASAQVFEQASGCIAAPHCYHPGDQIK